MLLQIILIYFCQQNQIFDKANFFILQTEPRFLVGISYFKKKNGLV